MTSLLPTNSTITYPDSDGQPMSDNTKQFRWIVLIKENLEILFANNPQVFVAGDLLWYPVEGRPDIRVAPDAMVVFGRPKGDRGSYKQWEEDHVSPHVVFEVLSPGNTVAEMSRKLLFYEHHGVEEYYIYDPDRETFDGFVRKQQNCLEPIEALQNWVSPRLGIQFKLTETGWVIYRPDETPFLSPVELHRLVLQEKERAEQEKQRADAAQQQADRLTARLRELGIDPDEIDSDEQQG